LLLFLKAKSFSVTSLCPHPSFLGATTSTMATAATSNQTFSPEKYFSVETNEV
jgi:hypothetical protein